MSKNSGLSRNAKLAVAMLVSLLVIWLVQPVISDRLDPNSKSSAVEIPAQVVPPPSDNLAAPNSYALPTVQDPFKGHIEKNGLEAGAPPAAAPSTAPVQSHVARVDPFKEHLELQNRQAKDAGISPFGK